MSKSVYVVFVKDNDKVKAVAVFDYNSDVEKFIEKDEDGYGKDNYFVQSVDYISYNGGLRYDW